MAKTKSSTRAPKRAKSAATKKPATVAERFEAAKKSMTMDEFVVVTMANPPTPESAAMTEKLAELAILGHWRFTADTVQEEVGNANRALLEAIEDIEAIVGTMADHLPDDRMPSRAQSRSAAVQLGSNAATLAELSHRVIRLAGRLEGLIEAAETDRSDRMLASYRNGNLGENVNVVNEALAIARREIEVAR